MPTSNEILKQLLSLSDKEKAKQAEYFGVRGTKLIGISAPDLRQIAKQLKTNHPLALQLWENDYHEARMLATIIADPKQISSEQMDNWTKDFDNWAIVDGACYNLYRYTPFSEEKIFQYVLSEKEYVRRTSFALIAGLAIGRKDIEDEEFIKYFPLIEKYAFDEKNYVWKAINWALRQIG